MAHVIFRPFLALIFFVVTVPASIGFAALSLKVHMNGLSFISPDYANTSNSTFAFVGLSLLTQENDKKNLPLFYIDLKGFYAPGAPVLNYLNISEVYFLQRTENVNISYGRKKRNWSGLDEAWDLGFFQPQFRWNSIDPQTQGQTGFFLENSPQVFKETGFIWMIFGSPVFVPDQGPSYELKEGQFQSTNPWFSSPPQQIEFAGQIFPIDYKIATPKTEDVAFQSTYGGQLGFQMDLGFYAKAAYMSTPSHQMAINYKAVLVADRVRVDIVPKSYREQNFSLDLGYKQNWGSVSAFLLSNQPEDVDYETAYNYAQIKPSFAWGPQVQLFLENFKLYGHGLFVNGGDVTEVGPDASQMSTPLTVKYLYKSAYKVGATYENKFNENFRYRGLVEWTESFQNTLKFLKIKNRLHFYRSFGVFVDFLLVDTSDETSTVSHLQNLDQVWAGVDYEF